MANKSVLAIGQSNMVGINAGSQITEDLRIKQISRGVDRGGYAFGSNNDVIPAFHQLQHDSYNTSEGATPHGPAIAYVEAIRNGVDVYCIIPAAKGDTGFSDSYWIDGGTGYNDAVAREAVADTAGYAIDSVIWLQGEKDTANLSYSQQLGKFIDDLRGDVGNVPFIAASIIEGGNADNIATNAVIEEVLRHKDKTAFVDATDLTSGNDGAHYSAANIATIGSRMGAARATAASYSLNRHPNQTHGFYANAGIETGATFNWHSQVGSFAFTQATGGEQPTNSRADGVTFADGERLELAADVTVSGGYTKIFRFTSSNVPKVNYIFQTIGGSSLRIGGSDLIFGSASSISAARGSTSLVTGTEYTVAITHAANGDMAIYFLDGETVTSEATGNSPVAQGGKTRLSYDGLTGSNTFGLVGTMKAALFYDVALTEDELAIESQRLDGTNLANPSSGNALRSHQQLLVPAGY